MKKENILKLLTVVRFTLKRFFLDYSFLIVVALFTILNLWVIVKMEVFTDSFSTQLLFNLTYYNGLLLIAYGGYLGSSIFTKELEENISSPNFMLPVGRSLLFFGKILSALIILGFLSGIFFLQTYISISLWGIISYLYIDWLANYSILITITATFTFLVSTIIGILSKKKIASMLFTSVYLIMSLFTSTLVESIYELNTKNILLVMSFPYLTTSFASSTIKYSGRVKSSILLIPLGINIWAYIISWALYKKVKL